MGFILCNRVSQIPGLSYFEYHFPALFMVLYFVAVLLVYSIVNAYQNRLFSSNPLWSALRQQSNFIQAVTIIETGMKIIVS